MKAMFLFVQYTKGKRENYFFLSFILDLNVFSSSSQKLI